MNQVHEKQTRETIVRLLSGMGGTREIQQYLKRFARLDAKRFAVVKVGGSVLRDDMRSLTSSLAFLQQVGLTPIVIHGGGPQLNAALQEAHIETRTVDGLRVTTPQTLAVARKVFQAQNLALVEALHAMDTRATPVISGVFNASYVNHEAYGLVGEVNHVELSPIESALRLESIPVIASLGETPDGQIVNINADYAAQALVKVLEPYKIVFLTGTGGLLDDKGEVIDSINLSSEYEYLIAQPWVHGGMQLKLKQIHSMLNTLPFSSSVSITKPAQLARELFTHKGSGTLVRRGEKILRFDGWQGMDKDRLAGLIESSFGRKLVPGYFDKVSPESVYISENYRAAMVITREQGMAYLDKFAVLAEAQGEGLGRAIWQPMRKDYPSLFWRSRRTNAINGFYDNECDGMIKQSFWKTYWYGVQDLSKIAECVAFCDTHTATLED